MHSLPTFLVLRKLKIAHIISKKWGDALAKSLKKLCSAVFSQGTAFETSGDQKFLKEQKFIQDLQGKTLRNLEKQKCSKSTATAKKLFPTVGKVQLKGSSSSETQKKQEARLEIVPNLLTTFGIYFKEHDQKNGLGYNLSQKNQK